MNPVIAKLFGQMVTVLEPIVLLAGKQIVRTLLKEIEAWLDDHPGQMSSDA